MEHDITIYTLECILDLAEAFIKGAGYADFEIVKVLIDTKWYEDGNGIIFNEISVMSKDKYVLELRWDIEEEAFYDYIDPEEEDEEDYGKKELPDFPDEYYTGGKK